jgi:predicted ATPase/transcriptional regulator with XRE-family HTH domain
MEQQSFGYWLRLKRKALDLTREELAERVGYSAATIRKIEDEERHPSAEVVERLAEVFNIPQEERSVFLRFARGDLKSAPRENIENVPWRPAPKSPRSNIPATTTSLIAREQEIAHVVEYLSHDDIRLVTLMGPPGIGKTRLSIETARATLADFPDGVFFVALAPLDDPKLIAFTMAQALGYVGAKNISTTEQLKEGIGDKNLLLVLDNCEHLIDAVASLASDFLSACPHLKILATSRESLRIPGEWLYAVPAFDLPTEEASVDVENASKFPALALFAERARAVRSDFALNTDNVETVAAICTRLDGLPLVIELIAARIRLMTPQALLDRLSGQFLLTADGMRAAAERQKTLHNAINWSYNLLPSEEQKLFSYLSVFSGGFTLEAVEAIFSRKVIEKPLPNLIALLLDKSLLKLALDAEASRETRYTMLATIQEFARGRLQDMGEEVEVRNLHLAYFLDLAEQADKELRGHNQLVWFSRLTATHDNLRAALDWAIDTKQTQIALQMARTLDWFWFVRSNHNEGRHWLQRVLTLSDISLYPELHSEILIQLAHHTWLQIGAEQAQPFVESALSLACAHSDKRNMAKALAILGLVMIFENSLAVASSYLEESKVLFQEVNDQWGFAHAVMCLGARSYAQDDWVAALALYEQVLELFRDLGDRFFHAVALRFIGDLQMKLGNLTNGMAALRESLILAQQLESKYEIAMTLWRCAEAEKRAEKPVRAVCLYWATKKLLDSIGAWTEGDELILKNDLVPCRAELSQAEFAEAEEKGLAMTMEQAIAYALEQER